MPVQFLNHKEGSKIQNKTGTGTCHFQECRFFFNSFLSPPPLAGLLFMDIYVLFLYLPDNKKPQRSIGI